MNSTATTTLLTVACRFIPYDQWLVTHVDSEWKIKRLKLWILAKCLNNPLLIESPPHNTASPVIFAQDPRHRPISPITFATRKVPLPDGSGESDDLDYNEDDERDDEDNDSDPSSVSAARSRLRRLHQQEQQPQARRRTSDMPSERPPQSTPGSLAYTAISPEASIVSQYTVIRYSTGQLLEDDFTLASYGIRSHELLELHRAGVILRLPRTALGMREYASPYFEGPVRALRVVWRERLTSLEGDFRARALHTHIGRQGWDGHIQESIDIKRKGKATTYSSDYSPTANSDPWQKHSHPKESASRRRTKLEWRDRWVVIREGILSLCKDRHDPAPYLLLPLDSLISVGGADYLSHITTNPGQRIVCLKFRSKTPTTKFAPSTIEVHKHSASSNRPLSKTPDLAKKTAPEEAIYTGPNPNTGPYLKAKLKGKAGSFPVLRHSTSAHSAFSSSPTLISASEQKMASLSRLSTRKDKGKARAVDVLDAKGGSNPPSPTSPTFTPVEELETPEEEPVEAGKPHLGQHGYAPASVEDREGEVHADEADVEDMGEVEGNSRIGTGDSDWVRVDDMNTNATVEKGHSIASGSRSGRNVQQANTGQVHESESGEWVALEMGDDIAYSSFLRTIHREFPHPIDSSFLPPISFFSTPTPTPVQTPSHSPVSHRESPWSPNAASSSAPPSTWSQENTTEDTPSLNSTADELNHFSLPNSRIEHGSNEPTSYTNTRHPAALANLSHSLAVSSSNFGALPYPEWRLDVIAKAGTAGLSELDRAVAHTFTATETGGDFATKLLAFKKERKERRRERRRTLIPDEGGNDGFLQPSLSRKEKTDHESMDEQMSEVSSGDEDSDSSNVLEWVGWVGDLPRQERRWRLAQGQAAIRAATMDMDYSAESSASQVPGHSHNMFQQGRIALEPTGIVSSTYSFSSATAAAAAASISPLSTAPTSPSATTTYISTPASLSSPSSRESISYRPGHPGRSLSFGVSPMEPYSNATSPSNSDASPLSTGQFASSSSGQDLGTRRPSMPTLPSVSSTFTFGDQAYHQDQWTSPLTARSPSFSSNSLINAPFGNAKNLHFSPVVNAAGLSSPSGTSSRVSELGVVTSTVSAGIPENDYRRRGSSAGIAAIFDSKGDPKGKSRETEKISKKLVKDAEKKEKERAKQAEKARQKERDLQGKRANRDKDIAKTDPGKPQRPTLSLAPVSKGSEPQAHTESRIVPQSPTNVSTAKALLRRVRSGSSLRSAGEEEPASPTEDGIPDSLPKKKKGLVRGVSVRAERALRKLDSALDFVDGR